MSSPLYERDLVAEYCNPLDELFCGQFRQWVADESRGPRSPGSEQAWERAILAPARHTLGENGKCLRARLTEVCWDLAGGEAGSMPSRLPLLVEILHAGSLIVDDIQDNSHQRRGRPTLHHAVGTPLAINTGNLFYCWALDLIPQLGLTPAAELQLFRRASSAMLRCHHGQGLDLSVRISEMPQHVVATLVQTTTRLKAGALMELAALFGTIAAGGSESFVQAIAEFGQELGSGLQMLDDLSGVLNPKRRHKAVEDISLQRPTWNWAWLARDLSASRFAKLQAKARDARTDADIAALVDEIADLVRDEGKERVHRHLREALGVAQETCGKSRVLTRLEQEIVLLEQSYV